MLSRKVGAATLAVSAICLAVLAVFLGSAPRGEELLAMHKGGERLLTGMYKEDVRVGERIIAEMGAKVSNPVWKELASDPRMRTQLAAALGAQKRGGGGGGFSLKGLLGGGGRGKGGAHGQDVRLRQGGGEGRRDGEVKTMSLAKATFSSRVRHAQHRVLQTLGQEEGDSPPLKFAYNVFASGVLDGRAASKQQAAPEERHRKFSAVAAAAEPVRSKKTVAQQHAEFVAGLKKATGFEDTYSAPPPSVVKGSKGGRVKKLEAEVQQLVRKDDSKSRDAVAVDLVEAVINEANKAPQQKAAASSSNTKGGEEKEDEKEKEKEKESPQARLKAFMARLVLGGDKDADAEVLKMLATAGVRAANSGGGVTQAQEDLAKNPVLRAVPVDAVAQRKAAKEAEERRKEADEARELEYSIKAETAIAYGGKLPTFDISGSSRKDEKAAAPADKAASPGMAAAPGVSAKAAVHIPKTLSERKSGDSASPRQGQESDVLVHHKGGQARELHDLEFKDDVVKASTLSQAPAITYGNSIEDRNGSRGGGYYAVPRESGDDSVSGGERDTVRALGFSTTQQYERHKMEGALQREREKVTELRRQRDEARGGLRPFGSRFGELQATKRELVRKVERDLGRVEDFMDDRRGGSQQLRMSGRGRSRHAVEVRSRGMGWRRETPRTDGEGSWRKFLRPLREDIRHVGDRQIALPAGEHVNLDII